MSWNEFYQRRDHVDAALRRAARGDLRIDIGPFLDETEFLGALQYKWTQLLTARIELALHSRRDEIDAVTEAWQRTRDENPALRRLLDEHRDHPGLATANITEQRTLAYAAKLVEPGDSAGRTARVGGTLMTLIRNTPPARRGLLNTIRRLASV